MKTASRCLEVSVTYFGRRFGEIRDTVVYPFYFLCLFFCMQQPCDVSIIRPKLYQRFKGFVVLELIANGNNQKTLFVLLEGDTVSDIIRNTIGM
jgi:hypothetical protein